jgi:hypothetical protein
MLKFVSYCSVLFVVFFCFNCGVVAVPAERLIDISLTKNYKFITGREPV